MDPTLITNQTKTRKYSRSNTEQIGNICICGYMHVIGFTCTYFTFNTGEENIDPTEQARQKRRQKYASLPEEEKERRCAMVRENYKRQKGKTYIKLRLCH